MKHRALGLLMVIITGGLTFLSAQKAPDFTVTDYNNKTHQLYSDYLNKNKVVVIKFFFIGCPPCASVAPYVVQAYGRNGSGAGNVEFFQISTLSSDKNASVKSYHQSKGFTFPGIGSDGGAAAALSPYKNGMFGTWYGTPTFVVIAPNGDVDYNVPLSGGNQYALDTAINRALRKSNGNGGGNPCTDAFTVKTITKIQPDGYLVIDYLNGNNSNVLDSGIYKCQFNLPNNLSQTYVTAYINRTEDAVTGISTADVVKIQRHILGLDTLNNLQAMLADVNNSSSVTAADVAEIRKLILGVTSKFARLTQQFGVMHNPKSKHSWDFSSKVLVSDLINKNKTNEFGAGKFGDITGAALFTSNSPIERVSFTTSLRVSKKQLSNGSFEHIFYLNENLPIEGFQLSLNYPLSGKILSITAHPDIDLMYQINPVKGSVVLSGLNIEMENQHFSSEHALFTVITQQEISLTRGEHAAEFDEWVSGGKSFSIHWMYDNKADLETQALVWFDQHEIYINSIKPIKGVALYALTGGQVKDIKCATRSLQNWSISNISLSGGFYILKINYYDQMDEMVKVFLR